MREFRPQQSFTFSVLFAVCVCVAVCVYVCMSSPNALFMQHTFSCLESVVRVYMGLPFNSIYSAEASRDISLKEEMRILIWVFNLNRNIKHCEHVIKSTRLNATNEWISVCFRMLLSELWFYSIITDTIIYFSLVLNKFRIFSLYFQVGLNL